MKKIISMVAVCLTLAGCGEEVSEIDQQLAEHGAPPQSFVADPDQGRMLYADACASCHGRGMRGSDQGPPLLHPYYEPGHHSDLSFYRAVKFGVQPHHWQFGAMPPRPEVSPEQAGHIVAYIRQRQRQAGIIPD